LVQPTRATAQAAPGAPSPQQAQQGQVNAALARLADVPEEELPQDDNACGSEEEQAAAPDGAAAEVVATQGDAEEEDDEREGSGARFRFPTALGTPEDYALLRQLNADPEEGLGFGDPEQKPRQSTAAWDEVQAALAGTDGLWIVKKEQKPAPAVLTLKNRLKKLIRGAEAAVSGKTGGTGTGAKNAKEEWMTLALNIKEQRAEAALETAGAKRAKTAAAAKKGAAAHAMVNAALGRVDPAARRSFSVVDPQSGVAVAPVGTPMDVEEDEQAGAASEQPRTKRQRNDGGAASAGVLRDVVVMEGQTAKDMQTERLQHEAAEKAAERAHALKLAEMAMEERAAAREEARLAEERRAEREEKRHEREQEQLRLLLQTVIAAKKGE